RRFVIIDSMAHRVRWLALFALAACAHHHPGSDGDGGVDGSYVADACEGLRCSQVDCGVKGLSPTSVSGTVYAPNGTLPLYRVTGYVPASDPGPLPDGVQCDKCSDTLPGDPIALTKTDEAGNFHLDDVPATADVPLVIQIGKWRRQIKLPNVAACQDTPLDPT